MMNAESGSTAFTNTRNFVAQGANH